jgi:hypothetical protein
MREERSNIVRFPCQPSQELRAEAASLTERYGKNPYSDFLLAHGKRPDRDHAASIGRIMGVRVRATDGSLQPQQTKAEQAAARRAKNYQRTEADYLDQVLRFRCVLEQLAKNDGDPADVIAYINPLFGDASVIREKLDHAVQWINRFAEEWNREQETRGDPRQI